MKIDKKPFFSIITVTRNSEKFIERNIRSLKNQSFKNFEHIIIDGGSKVVLQSGDSVEAVASAASSIDIITSVVDTISA